MPIYSMECKWLVPGFNLTRARGVPGPTGATGAGWAAAGPRSSFLPTIRPSTASTCTRRFRATRRPTAIGRRRRRKRATSCSPSGPYRQHVPRLRSDLPPADVDRAARVAGGLGPAGRARGRPVRRRSRRFPHLHGRGQRRSGIRARGPFPGRRAVGELIRTEIDPHEDVRERLVAAYLAGAAVAVPEGAAGGGDVQSVPLWSALAEVPWI
jgi:hypothetical protein